MTSKVFVALKVPADAQTAFAAFTQEIALWWTPDQLFRITGQGDGRLEFEPGVGGRLITSLPNGEVFEIGRISVWEPGERLVFSWRQAAFSAEQVTEVEVKFEPVDEETTRVCVEHRAWDTIPKRNASRHGFPESATLRHVADWWRASLNAFASRIGSGAGAGKRST